MLRGIFCIIYSGGGHQELREEIAGPNLYAALRREVWTKQGPRKIRGP